MLKQPMELSAPDFRRLRRHLHQQLIASLEQEDEHRFDDIEALRARINELISETEAELERPLAPAQRIALADEILHEVEGLGPLAALMIDPSVSDILINGPQELWVDRAGSLQKTELSFDNEAHLRRFLDRLIAAQGKHLDTSCPAVDARLADGSRLHAMIAPLCAQGPVVSIRRFVLTDADPQTLLEGGMLSTAMLELLQFGVDAGLNILVAGGAAAGKTTLLNAISEFIPTHARVITIEESAELQLRHPHVVTLEARQGNSEGRGQFDLRALLRNALRMRADRIIVGEVRGTEVFEMLQAMNVGHDGSLSTLHANSPCDVLKRLESLALLADVGLPREAIRDMIGSAIQLIVQVARFRDGSRCVTSIGEVIAHNGSVEVHEIFRFVPAADLDDNIPTGKALNRCGEHRHSGYVPSFLQRLRQRGYRLPSGLAGWLETRSCTGRSNHE